MLRLNWTNRPAQRSEESGVVRWVVVCSFALVFFVVLRVFVMQTFRIPSASMVPTLQVGDHIVVSKLAYGLHLPIVNKWLWRRERPNRGDVVVFFRFSKFETFDVQKHYIKRIVAVPGDLVEVRERIAYVNDRPTEYGAPELFQVAPSDDEAAAEAYGPVKLKSDEYFVLGDNRSNSRDSRYFGPIHFSDIQGKANLIYWSSERLDGKLRIRWDRIGKAIE